jgi:hypothetical protein
MAVALMYICPCSKDKYKLGQQTSFSCLGIDSPKTRAKTRSNKPLPIQGDGEHARFLLLRAAPVSYRGLQGSTLYPSFLALVRRVRVSATARVRGEMNLPLHINLSLLPCHVVQCYRLVILIGFQFRS